MVVLAGTSVRLLYGITSLIPERAPSFLVRPALVFYPQLVKTGDTFAGEWNTACCGHSARHQQHVTQSRGYFGYAFLLSLLSRITSAGQLRTHIPQPMHLSGSIRSIAILPASLKFSVVCSWLLQQSHPFIHRGSGRGIFAGKAWTDPATTPLALAP